MEQTEVRRFTYADYLAWDDDMRREIINGTVYAMSPAPSWFHQAVSGGIFTQLSVFLKGKPCKVFSAPFDVRLNADLADDAVVQPDITVVCDRSMLDRKGGGCNGVPAMVVEVLSPSTSIKDRITKRKLYEESGVREYWIVDTKLKIVEVFLLYDGRYFVKGYTSADIVPVQVLDGCKVNLADVFAETADEQQE